MREDRNDRVIRRSSTGGQHEPQREQRERIRLFDNADELYQDENKDRDDDRHYRDDDRRYRDDDRHYRDDDRRYRDDDRRYRDDDRRYHEEDRRYRDDDRRYRGDDRRYREEDREEDRRYRNDDRREREPVRRRAGGPRRRRSAGHAERFVHQILPYVLFWMALFGAVSLVLRDLFHLDGAGGEFGSFFADFLCGLMGPIAYLLPLFFVVIALRWRTYVKEGVLFQKLLLSGSFLVLLSAIVHVFIEASGNNNRFINAAAWELYTAGVNFSGGGLFGGFVGEYMGYAIYPLGTGLLAIPLLLIIGIYMVGLTPAGLWQRISTRLKQSAERRREREAARYDGKEVRRLRTPKQSQPAAVKEAESPKLTGNTAAAESPRSYYDFGEDAEELVPPVPRPKKPVQEEQPKAAPVQETASEVLDIPNDEPEIVEDHATAILNRAGHTEDPSSKLSEILRSLEEERVAKTAAPAAAPSVAEPAPKAEEKPLQGSYYAPFALPIRPEPNHGREEKETASHIVIQPREEQSTAAAAPAAPVYTAPAAALREEALGSTAAEPHVAEVSYDNGVRTERHPSTTIYKKDPVAASQLQQTPAASETPAAAPYTAPAAPAAPAVTHTAPVTPAAPIEEPVEEPVQPVSFERARVAAEPIVPVRATAVVAPAPIEEAEEEITPPAPKRADFSMPGEEPSIREEKPTAAPTPVRPEPVRPVRPEPTRPVAAKAEVIKEEPKPKPEPPRAPREHVLPPIHLLNEDKTVKETNHDAENQEKIDILRETLASFNVRIRDQIECARGPAITRYEFRPEVGVSVRQVINRQDDMSLALAADVRIEAPVPGKPVIGIEVPNAVRETVFMRTLLESEQFKNSKKPLEVPIGLGIGGNIVMCDLATMPHALVAGTTGSGKSVCINTILISLMYKTTPRDLRLILIDPKKVEFAAFAHVPHLYLPIVTEMPRAVGALACAVQEMERRYTLMEDVGARNIEEYNDMTKNDPDREHLPYMLIVIDEFADLKMGSTTNAPENFTCRIAQKARAAGMHLIIGTQRPSVDVITGKLKNNIPSRIAFTVKSQVDSRTILDSIGAESLCGKGDMLYFPVSQNKPSRVQGAYVSGREVESVIRYIIEHNDEVQYNREFMDQIEVEMARAANAGRKGGGDSFDDIDDDDEGGEDPKFREAVELAIETQKVATSLLQRRLGVGYGRAAKIIDRMEDLGYVSAPEGNKARKVLITYQEFLAKMGGGEEEEDEYNT